VQICEHLSCPLGKVCWCLERKHGAALLWSELAQQQFRTSLAQVTMQPALAAWWLTTFLK
jgi:hypothetical protein